ncbi:MAG: DUF192 domain-containing protein [Burkholderiales bacterium]|nr:DUF192 domain-containing protein [Burkholderiales bacterium]
MRLGALFDESGKRCVLGRVWKAGNAWERARGLLGRPRLGDGEGFLLEPCSSVHCIGMTYALDLAYVDRRGRVCKLVQGLKPWRFSASLQGHATLEMAAGALQATGIRLGDVLVWREDAEWAGNR